MSTFIHLLLSSPSSLKLLPGCVSHSLTLLFVCVNLLPIFFHLYLSSLPSTPPFSPPLPFVFLAPLYFISFHHPSEQNCIAKIPRALLSITMSLNVRTRSLLLQKAHHTPMPHNADLHSRCSGNVAECVVINCAEIDGLHKVLSMPFYVRSLPGCTSALCAF